MRTYRITHRTSYEYEAPVLHAHHLARLRPRPTDAQKVESTEFEVTPRPATQRRMSDYFGNDGDRIEVLETHDLLTVVAKSRVTLAPRAPTDEISKHPVSWEDAARRLREDRTLLGARELVFDSPLVRAHRSLADYTGPTFAAGRPLVEAVLELSYRVNTEFAYDSTATDVSTPLAQVLRERRGVCQDFAHVLVGCLRTLGLAARYVSGYLETAPPPGQPRLVGADASHAWAAVFVPDRGWLEVDPTNDVVPTDRHVVLGWGRDFSDVSPLVGVVLGGGAHRLTVGVDVEHVTDEPPRSSRQPSTATPG